MLSSKRISIALTALVVGLVVEQARAISSSARPAMSNQQQQQQQQQQVSSGSALNQPTLSPMQTISSGAQLFQSPAALAAVAAAAAAAAAAAPNMGAQANQLAPANILPVSSAPLVSNQQQASIAANLLSPALPSVVSARVDTAELLKQAGQQQQPQQQQQQQAYNFEQGKSINLLSQTSYRLLRVFVSHIASKFLFALQPILLFYHEPSNVS